jgi:hypothetical protein
MSGLKKKIRQQELAVIMHKNDLREQIDQLEIKIQKRMVSPLGLTTIFVAGALVAYLIRPKKKVKKIQSDSLSVLNRLVAHMSLLVSIRRLFSML